MNLPAVILNTRLWLVLCLGTLATMIALSVLAHVAMPESSAAAARIALPVYFALFLVLGFSALPLMTSLFVAGLEGLWTRMGLAERPWNARALALVRRHRVHFVLVVWGLFVAGLALAAPHIIRAWNEATPPT